MSQEPIALCKLDTSSKTCYQWIVMRCPFCGKEHRHGAGGTDPNEARRLLGYRVPHCVDIEHDSEYLLVEATLDQIAEIEAEKAAEIAARPKRKYRTKEQIQADYDAYVQERMRIQKARRAAKGIRI